MTRRTALALVLLMAAGPGCARPARDECRTAVTDGGYVMGTVLEITLVVRERAGTRDLVGELLDRARALEALFTTYDPDSTLMRLNRSAGQGPQVVDPRLAAILRDAVDLSRATDGAFDVTVGPVVDLWVEAARRDRVPLPAQVRDARARVGAHRIRVEDDRVALAPGTRVDLGALAKGWTLDRLGERLAGAPVCGALLDFGQSSLLAWGRAPDGPRWRLALRGGDGEVLGLVHLRDRALSVSGSLGQWSEIGGVRYGHVVDPRTGRALRRNRVAAVVAPSGAAAEAWSTALVVTGPAGLAAVEARPDTEALVQTGPSAQVATPGWAQAVDFRSAPGRR